MAWIELKTITLGGRSSFLRSVAPWAWRSPSRPCLHRGRLLCGQKGLSRRGRLTPAGWLEWRHHRASGGAGGSGATGGGEPVKVMNLEPAQLLRHEEGHRVARRAGPSASAYSKKLGQVGTVPSRRWIRLHAIMAGVRKNKEDPSTASTPRSSDPSARDSDHRRRTTSAGLDIARRPQGADREGRVARAAEHVQAARFWRGARPPRVLYDAVDVIHPDRGESERRFSIVASTIAPLDDGGVEDGRQGQAGGGRRSTSRAIADALERRRDPDGGDRNDPGDFISARSRTTARVGHRSGIRARNDPKVRRSGARRTTCRRAGAVYACHTGDEGELR